MRIDRDWDCYPTAGQIERSISQKINTLYHHQLAHRASKVDCHLFDNKIIIFGEEVITPIEKILLEASSIDLVHQVRTLLDSSIKTKLEELIEEIVGVKVKKCIYNTDLGTNSTIAIIILAHAPKLRPKKAKLRLERKNVLQFSQRRNELENQSINEVK
ncbi:MAG: DUF2294 domain-containing protein [Xenococcaceae cyanobacterium]